MQHDGAKAHTEETVQGTIEDSSFTGDGEDDVRVDVLQQPSNSPDCNIWDIGGFNALFDRDRKMVFHSDIGVKH